MVNWYFIRIENTLHVPSDSGQQHPLLPIRKLIKDQRNPPNCALGRSSTRWILLLDLNQISVRVFNHEKHFQAD